MTRLEIQDEKNQNRLTFNDLFKITLELHQSSEKTRTTQKEKSNILRKIFSSPVNSFEEDKLLNICEVFDSILKIKMQKESLKAMEIH